MPVVTAEMQSFPRPTLVFGAGVLVLAMVWVVGPRTCSFLVMWPTPSASGWQPTVCGATREQTLSSDTPYWWAR